MKVKVVGVNFGCELPSFGDGSDDNIPNMVNYVMTRVSEGMSLEKALTFSWQGILGMGDMRYQVDVQPLQNEKSGIIRGFRASIDVHYKSEGGEPHKFSWYYAVEIPKLKRISRRELRKARKASRYREVTCQEMA